MKRGAAEVIVLPNANFTHKALSVGIKDWNSVDQYRYYQCVFDPVGKFVSVLNVCVLCMCCMWSGVWSVSYVLCAIPLHPPPPIPSPLFF